MIVLAGDNSKPAADASYKDLLWENFYVDHSFRIGNKIRSNKEIGTIDSWGPFFRVRFDLIIHSLRQDDYWFSVLDFSFKNSIKLPGIFLTRSGVLTVGYSINSFNQFHIVNFNVEINVWYNIVIDLNSVNGKVKK